MKTELIAVVEELEEVASETFYQAEAENTSNVIASLDDIIRIATEAKRLAEGGALRPN